MSTHRSLRALLSAVRLASVLLAGVGVSAQTQIQPLPVPNCPPFLRDHATGGCLIASSAPMDGALLPLSEPLFVDPGDNVGMGTKSPEAQLGIRGHCGKPLTGTVSIGIGSTTATGTGTAFNAELLRGAAICIGGESFTVTQVLGASLIEVSPAAAMAHTGVQAETDGDLLAISSGAGRRLLTLTNSGQLAVGPFDGQGHLSRVIVSTSDIGLEVNSYNPFSPPSLAQILYAQLVKDTLAVDDRDQIALGFFANDDGMGNPDRRFYSAIESIVESPANSTKSAALRFLTPSSGNNFPGEKMRITGSGNVGIGTTTPTATLHVVGNVVITGNLSKGSGSFRIDHPLDPKNQYLSHSFVESPDMLDVYSGNVALGEDGSAWVDLPAWFEALNESFRYQLTCLGGFAPVYVAEEITENRFRIAGGTPGLRVSWQVSGVRHDAYAQAHRIVVEEEKPEGERGTYLHPEAFAALSGPR